MHTCLGDIIYLKPNEVGPKLCFEACIVAADREGFSVALSADMPDSRVHFLNGSLYSDHRIFSIGLAIGTYCLPFHSQDTSFLVESLDPPPNRPRHRRT